MEHDEAYIRHLVQRYISGTATDEELEAFLHLLEEGKLEKILAEAMDHEIERQELKMTKRRHIAKPSWRTLKIAATVTIFFVFGLLLVGQYDRIIHGDATPVRYIRVETARSEIREVVLNDGSKLWLNAGSVLEYPEAFDDTVRMVRLLDGEAFFAISHDPDKPFIVCAGEVRTQVLGTEFNIRSYRTLETIQVTVASGKVKVKDLHAEKGKQHDAVLEAHDQLSIDKQTGTQKKSRINVLETLGWRDGKLFFNDERFADVAAILANKFDVQIVFADSSIKDYRFSASFEATDSLSMVFDALSLANNLRYTINNNVITLKKIDNPK